MGNNLGRVVVFQGLIAVVLASAACNKSKNNDRVDQGQENAGGAAPVGPGPGRQRGPIGEVMSKLGRKGQSLTEIIGNQLKTEPTPWDTIQPQAIEYVQLASSLSNYNPPRGDKESWAKLTGDFSKTATDLEQAIKAKDKTVALTVHHALQASCKTCHDAHQNRRGGPSRMGMPPGGFRGPGGPGGPTPPPQ